MSVGVVGTGYWGKNIARNFYELGALGAVCDIDRTKLGHYTTLYGVRGYENYKDMLLDSYITSIAIAAPAFQHYRLAKEALLAGKDLFVEKPMAMNLAEAEKLQEIACREKRILMVGHILQYHPCVQSLLQLVQAGELGELRYIASNRLALGAIRVEESALWNFAPHDISIILALCGGRLPEKVDCRGADCISKGVADISLLSLTFTETLQAHIYVSWLNPFKEQRLTIVGSDGLAVFDDTKSWQEKLQIYRKPIVWCEEGRPTIRENAEYVEVEPKEPLKEECRHFLECCSSRKEPITSGLEGLRVMQVLEQAQKSMEAFS